MMLACIFLARRPGSARASGAAWTCEPDAPKEGNQGRDKANPFCVFAESNCRSAEEQNCRVVLRTQGMMSSMLESFFLTMLEARCPCSGVTKIEKSVSCSC